MGFGVPSGLERCQNFASPWSIPGHNSALQPQNIPIGLKERRALKDFEENHFPDLKSKMVAALGFEPEMEVQ